ncbi:DNA ligase [Shewanella gelidimarina]|uniref:DNA ligase n=1 Tax=Shewanella gelidimarina TaxID=56813 RepID=UPI00200C4062|nr:DNA ligase [Shewanella gelidimarina]MCL1058082.1 DNA ligase [Shewanella gelidimarina]
MTKISWLSSELNSFVGLCCGGLAFFFVVTAELTAAEMAKPPIQLAKEYKQQRITKLSDYLISEKLDGVRGYWNGSDMLSRSGRVINVPNWFVEGFPNYPIDGELWIDRNHFEQVSAIVRKNNASKAEWLQVSFMVFDLPAESTPFIERYEKALADLSQISPYINVIEQFSIGDQAELDARLNVIVEANGEGLMLHRKTAHYQIGRSNDIVKLKPVYDAEAVVLAHQQGKGKYTGMMGALLVESMQGKRFSIGSGFTDEERRNPPKVGSVITFKYYGKTQKGTPRFASFLRVRDPF